MKRIISICCIIIFSFVLTTSCGGGGDNTQQTAENKSNTATQNLNALLPDHNDLEGWTREGESRFFGPGNLWEYINGAADGYLMYGFQLVVTADYNNTALGNDAVIDIYEMADEVNAFGIYANERNPGYDFEKIGVEGYAGETSINFWSGRYYIKITTFEDNDVLMAELRKMASKIVSNINSTVGEPVQLSFFPVADQVSYTAKYIPSDVLGQSYISNAFEVIYETGEKEYKAILVSLDTPESASSALERYKEFISGSGRVTKDLSSPGENGFYGEDSFYGSMIAARSGSSIGILLSIPSESKGTVLLAELLANIQ